MTKESSKLQTWQIFHLARKALGPETVSTIFGKRNARSAYDWGQNPSVTAHRCNDPLEAMIRMLREMDRIGFGYVVDSVIKLVSSAREEEDTPPLNECLPTLKDEVLADFEAVAALQTAIREEETPERIEQAYKAARAELDRTWAFCRQKDI